MADDPGHPDAEELPADAEDDLSDDSWEGGASAFALTADADSGGAAVSITDFQKTKSKEGDVILGRYRLERFIARGGMGAVYLATQLGLDRKVAIKLLAPRLSKAREARFARRFFLEASTSAKLVHPNIVTVHDYGESESGELFIAMEYIDGEPLSELIKPNAPMPLVRVLSIALQICRALREAHGQGVVHRDLKVQNIMVVRGADEENPDRVKVLDFGLLKLVRPANQVASKDAHSAVETDLTLSGPRIIGSPRYMSPDQICGDTIDARTDIYSFGVILFEMLAGELPFQASSKTALLYQHLTAAPPAIASVGYRRPVPENLERIVKKCLEKPKDKRYGSMVELIEDLRSVRADFADPEPPSYSSAPAPVSPPIPANTEELSVDEALKQASLHEPGLMELTDPGVGAPSKLPWAIALFALVGLAAALGALSQRGLAPPPTNVVPPAEVENAVPPPPPAAVLSDEVRVTFESIPPGARVEEQGAVIGVTPFIRSFPRPERPLPRRFVFLRDGFEPFEIERPLEGERMTVSVALRAAPPPAKSPPRAHSPKAAAPSTAVSRTEAHAEQPEPTKREPETVEAPPQPRDAGVAEESAATVAPTKPSVPEPHPVQAAPAPPPTAKNVPSHVLEHELLSKTDPTLPPAFRAAHRGERVRIVVLVCTHTSGNVDRERTRIIRSVPGADEAVLEAVRRWRYRPQRVPLCAPVHFEIDVEK